MLLDSIFEPDEISQLVQTEGSLLEMDEGTYG